MEKQVRTRDIKLVPIGNSQGVRIPKALLQKYGLSNSLVLEETAHGLLLRKKREDKLSWEDTFRPWPRKEKTGRIWMLPCWMAWRKPTLVPKRYTIYLADLNPTIDSEISKIRPVVIVSQDAMNQYLETVVVCPLTSKLHRKWRSRLQITCAGEAAEIAVDQIQTISKKRLKDRIDQLPAAQASQLRRIITEMYGE